MSDWIGALIGAAERGLHLALKKGKPKDYNPILQRVNWAKKAGIHPIYALGGGFNSGFAGPEVSWGDGQIGTGIGDAISGLYDEIQAGGERRDASQRYKFATHREQMNEQQWRMRENVRDAETKRYNDAQINLIEAQTATENARLAEMLRGGSRGGNVSDPNMPVRLGAFRLGTDDASPAQTVQNEYGDLVESGYGAGKLIYDIIRQLGGDLSSKSPEELRKYGGY